MKKSQPLKKPLQPAKTKQVPRTVLYRGVAVSLLEEDAGMATIHLGNGRYRCVPVADLQKLSEAQETL